MTTVIVVYPACQHACRSFIHETGIDDLLNRLFIIMIQHIEGGLSKILVPNGDLSRDDIRKRVDKYRRTGEIIVGVVDRRLIMTVSIQRTTTVKQDDSTVFARLGPVFSKRGNHQL